MGLRNISSVCKQEQLLETVILLHWVAWYQPVGHFILRGRGNNVSLVVPSVDWCRAKYGAHRGASFNLILWSILAMIIFAVASRGASTSRELLSKKCTRTLALPGTTMVGPVVTLRNPEEIEAQCNSMLAVAKQMRILILIPIQGMRRSLLVSTTS